MCGALIRWKDDHFVSIFIIQMYQSPLYSTDRTDSTKWSHQWLYLRTIRLPYPLFIAIHCGSWFIWNAFYFCSVADLSTTPSRNLEIPIHLRSSKSVERRSLCELEWTVWILRLSMRNVLVLKEMCRRFRRSVVSYLFIMCGISVCISDAICVICCIFSFSFLNMSV